MTQPKPPPFLANAGLRLNVEVRTLDGEALTGAAAAEALARELHNDLRLYGWHSPDDAAAAVRGAFARSNLLLDADDPGAVSEHLAEIADKAAGSYRKAMLTGNGEFAALYDLLACVSALTDLCGCPRTPTAAEVTAGLQAETGMSAARLLLGPVSQPAEQPAAPAPAETAVFQIGSAYVATLAGATPVDTFGPNGDAFMRTVEETLALTPAQIHAFELAQAAHLAAVGRQVERCKATAYGAAVQSGRWRPAANLIEQAPHPAYAVKLATLVRDLIGPADYATLVQPWVEAFGSAPGRPAERTAEQREADNRAYDALRRLLVTTRHLSPEQVERLGQVADAVRDGFPSDSSARHTADRAIRAAMNAGRWWGWQDVVEEEPAAARDVKLAVLASDLISPEDYNVLTAAWFATFGRGLWDDGKAAGQ